MASIGTPVTDEIQVDQTKSYDLTISRAGKYVVELSGPAQVQFGIWQGMVSPSTGKLRVCGSGAWGCRLLDASFHAIQVKGLQAGSFTFLVRQWSLWDYWYIGKHKSTC